MDIQIPSAAEIARRLAPMKASQLQRLAELSGVPFHTLLKIKRGDTENPGIETVRKFAPHIEAATHPAPAEAEG